jgi:chromosome partitioning protein
MQALDLGFERDRTPGPPTMCWFRGSLSRRCFNQQNWKPCSLPPRAVELAQEPDRDQRLKSAIAPVLEDYDYIFIDCPPSLDILTVNALIAANSVLIPIQCEYFALEGVSELMETVRQIRRLRNPELEIEGVLLTMFDERTNLSHQVMQDLKEFFGNQVFSTIIPRNIRLGEAPSHGRPILLYDIKSKGAESYIRLAKEILHGTEKSVGTRIERSVGHAGS